MTAQQMLDWIEEHAREKLDPQTPALEAACWFIAVHDARAIFDSFTVKDLAREMLDGGLASPDTMEEVQDWLEFRVPELPDGTKAMEEIAEDDKRLVEEMREHFGLTT